MFDFMYQYYPAFIDGTAQTIIISLIGGFRGTILGVVLVLFRMSKVKFLRGFARVYIAIVRGTPAMIQVMLIYYTLSKCIEIAPIHILGSSLDRTLPGSLASAAYTAEIFRIGISGVAKGQMEAGLSLGLSHIQTMRFIILPQAIRTTLPALGNEFISLTKESSVFLYIGVQEVTAQDLGVGGTLYDFVAPLLVAAGIYFVLTFTFAQLLSILEKHFAKKYQTLA
jgi:His/Glu/Gln/Arg/opine family amino acid ABC transporter permease subunit